MSHLPKASRLRCEAVGAGDVRCEDNAKEDVGNGGEGRPHVTVNPTAAAKGALHRQTLMVSGDFTLWRTTQRPSCDNRCHIHSVPRRDLNPEPLTESVSKYF